MLNKIDDLKKTLKEQELSDEDINNFVEKVNPCYEFYDFMLKEYNKDQKTVDDEAEKYSTKLLPKYQEKLMNLKEDQSKIQFIVEMSGDIMKKYANKYKYNKSDELKNSINFLMEIQFKSKFTS